MILRILGILLIIIWIPGNNHYQSLHQPRIYLLILISLVALKYIGLKVFYQNIKRSPVLLFTTTIFIQIILLNNIRGYVGSRGLIDGLWLWIIILISTSAIKSLSEKQKEQLRSGIITGVLILVIIIFYHATTTIEIVRHPIFKRGFLMYSWSDHLSLVLLAGFVLVRKSMFKLLILISMALVFAKSSLIIGFLSLKHNSIKKSIILALVFLVFVQFYQTFLYENDTLYNSRGFRLSKREAVSKRFDKNIPDKLLHIGKNKNEYDDLRKVTLGNYTFYYHRYFYQNIYDQIEKDNKSIIGYFSNQRLTLWKYKLKMFIKQVNKKPIKLLIGDGFQGVPSDNIIFMRKPNKSHFMPLEIFTSTGLIGLILYCAVTLRIFGLTYSLALIPWYHSIEFTPVLAIAFILNNYHDPICQNIKKIYNCLITKDNHQLITSKN